MGVLDTTGRVMDVAAMDQAKDIQASENVGIYGLLREKRYIKSKHLAKSCHARELPFTEPYQVAAYKLHVPWTRTNKAVMVQTAGCNLQCPYCFCGEEVVVEASVDEIWSDYWENYCGRADNPSPIFRISGGEPFLQQEFVANLVRCMTRRTRVMDGCIVGDSGVYVWVNTNLTVTPTEDLLNSLNGYRIGLVGSWKSVSAPEKFEKQIDTATRLIDAGVDAYFYYPCSLDEEDEELLLHGVWDDHWTDIIFRWSSEFLSHLNSATKHLGDYYATRLNPITIYYDYETVGKPKLFSMASEIKRDFMLQLLEKFVRRELGEEYWWLPDHMIDVREGAGR